MSRWVLVTGAAKRIGREIALELADAGWNIIVHYHTSRDDAETLLDDILAMDQQACLAEIDLRNSKLVESFIPSLAENFGYIAGLVNNASFFTADAGLTDGGAALKAVNTEAPRILSEAFFNQMPADKTGAIINLLDADPSHPGFDAYNASKSALAALTEEMALRFAPRVRVNGLALGPVIPAPDQRPEHFQKLVDATPLRLQVTSDAVAATTCFLLENPFMTGDIVHIDSGLHLTASKKKK